MKTFELTLSELTTCTVLSPDIKPSFLVLVSRIDVSELSTIRKLLSTPLMITVGESANSEAAMLSGVASPVTVGA